MTALMLLLGATAFAQSGAEFTGKDAETALETGIGALKAGDAATAVQYLSPAITSSKLDRNRAAVALFHRAAAYQRLKKCAKAIEDYNRAIALDVFAPPVLALAFYNRGLCYDAAGRPSAALNDFSHALTINAGFAQAYNARADILRNLGRNQDAIRDYQASLRHRHPQPHLSLYGQAMAHAALRQETQARAALERALVARPDFVPARQKLEILNEGGDIRSTVPVQAQAPPKKRASADPATTGSLPDDARQALSGKPEPRAMAAVPPQLASGQAPPRPAPGPRIAAAERRRSGRDAPPPSVLTSAIPPGMASAFVPGPGFERAAERNSPAREIRRRAPAGSYLLQLSAQRDEASARGAWQRLAREHDDILGTLTPYIQPVHIEDKGTFYRLRAGPFETRADVEQTCRVLRARGGDCFVAAAR